MEHVHETDQICTEHVQRLLREALRVAEHLDGLSADHPIRMDDREMLAVMALDWAADCAWHAAAEFRMERGMAFGFHPV